MSRQATLARVMVLALSGASCGLLSGVAALYVQVMTLSPNDGAYGLSVLQLLGDPFVYIVWLPAVLGPAFIGFMASLWALWNVRLAKAIPLTIAMTVAAAAIGAGVFVFLGIPVGFVAAVVTMNWCRGHAQWQLPQERLELEGIARLGGRRKGNSIRGEDR